MSEYDFKNLSHHDFELLVGGLLSKEWRFHLESFKSGRDGGIDLRYSKPKGNSEFIIQCKHYAISGYSQLYASLKKEIPKVKRINPDRYALVTSIGLTPKNKDDIKKLLHPYIQSTGDVIGRTDLNLMLQRYPEVEQANFKLWLTSTAVLKRVLHNAEHCQTEFAIEKITSKLPLYVQNDAFPRAINIINESNIVVISGIPGIGKTTLAEMLIYSHMAAGYRPVVIKSELVEGKRLYDKSALQVFYFDDFLGQTFLHEARGLSQKNEDADLADFMEMVRNSKNTKLIMTTREHILSKAISDSERLRHSPIISHKCVLSLSDYNTMERAKILYNHIYSSKLPSEYRSELLSNGFYKSILKHRNFNPRLIEWLSDYHRVRTTPSVNYQNFVTEILENPHEIWRNAFFHQISSASRSLLLFIYSMSGKCSLKKCESGWLSLYSYQSKKYNYRMSEEGFFSFLKEIEGSFIKIENGSVDFINPSVIDFFHSLMKTNYTYIEDLVCSTKYFTQLVYLWNVRIDNEGFFLRNFITKDVLKLSKSIDTAMKSPAYEYQRGPIGVSLAIIDTFPEQRMQWMLEVAEATQFANIFESSKAYLSELVDYWHNADIDFEGAFAILSLLENAKSEFIAIDLVFRYEIRSAIFKRVSTCNYFQDFIHIEEYSRYAKPALSDDEGEIISNSFMNYIRSGVEQDLHETSKNGEDLSSIKEFLEDMMSKYGYDIRKYVEIAEQSLAEYEDYHERYADYQYSQWKESRHEDKNEFDPIDNMFQSLK